MKEKARGVTLWLPDSLRGILEQYAERYGVTLSVAVRELVEAGLHERVRDLEGEAWRRLYGREASERLKILRWGKLSNELVSPEARLVLQEWLGLIDGPWAPRYGDFLPFNETDRASEATRSLAHFWDVRSGLAGACRGSGGLGRPELAIALTSNARFYVEAYVEVRGGERVLTRLGRLVAQGTYHGYRWPDGAFTVAWSYPSHPDLETAVPEHITPEITERVFAYPAALAWVQAWRRRALDFAPLDGGEIPDPKEIGRDPNTLPPAFARLTIAEPEGRGKTLRWRLWRDEVLLPLPSDPLALVERELGYSIDAIRDLIRQDIERYRAFYEVFGRELEWRGQVGEPYGPYVLGPYWERADHLHEFLVAHGWDPVAWAVDWVPCLEQGVKGVRLASSLYRRLLARYGTPAAASEYADYAETELIRRALVHRLQQRVWAS